MAVPNDEMLGAFLRQHYANRSLLPDEILVPTPTKDDYLEIFKNDVVAKF